MPPTQDARAPESLLAEVGGRTLALAAAAARLGSADVAAPSGLPGWSRGHVLAHVANQADAAGGVLLRAADGEVASMYPSQAERDAAIDAGASASPEALVLRVLESAARLHDAWRALPEDRLDVEFTAPAGWFRPVRDVPWLRWREVALHAVDLRLGQGAPFGGPGPGAALAERLLAETAEAFAARAGVPPLELVATDTGRTYPVRSGAAAAGAGGPVTTVRGGTGDLVLWLTGRTDGAGLSPSGALPALPAWL